MCEVDALGVREEFYHQVAQAGEQRRAPGERETIAGNHEPAQTVRGGP
jgi:hypothetical protein